MHLNYKKKNQQLTDKHIQTDYVFHMSEKNWSRIISWHERYSASVILYDYKCTVSI